MSEKIVTLNEEVIKGQIKELVRGSVEETLNELLKTKAEKLRRRRIQRKFHAAFNALVKKGHRKRRWQHGIYL